MKDATHSAMSRGLILLLAISAGLTVANTYYNQSLLELISQDFRVSHGAASSIAIATQLGYAAGLLLLVPLGDILNRRALIVTTAVISSLALLAVAYAPSVPWATTASLIMGALCITPQLIVPYAAHLADPAKRGRIVGMVMSGLVIGILFARSAAGFLGALCSWRTVFICGAVATLLDGLLLWCMLPPPPPTKLQMSYGKLLASLGSIWCREPILRRHALLGALSLAAFSAFWTTLAFYLASRPEHYGSAMVGVFGLVAIAGAMAAPISGYFSDKLSARAVNGFSLLLMLAGFLLMGLANWSLLWLAVAVFLMDGGAQANHISNQTRIYTLHPELRNRVTSIYMVSYFVGGAIGSALGTHAWLRWGWTGVWLTGVCLALLGLLRLACSKQAKRI